MTTENEKKLEAPKGRGWWSVKKPDVELGAWRRKGTGSSTAAKDKKKQPGHATEA